MLNTTFGIWLWPQLNWFSMYMLRHSFVSKFLKEVSIIVILIFCLKISTSKMSLICSYLLSIYSFATLETLGLIKKIMVELIKSITTSITNLLRRYLIHVRKIVKRYITPLPQLTHLFPMHPFSTPSKHQETLQFFNVFRG